MRPTKIRLEIGALLFDGHDKHVCADDVIALCAGAGVKASVASVYNTLNQFVCAGLLRRVTVDQAKTYFDTNLTRHHHFYYEDEDRLEDIALADVVLAELPTPPDGRKIKSVEVTIRV